MKLFSLRLVLATVALSCTAVFALGGDDTSATSAPSAPTTLHTVLEQAPSPTADTPRSSDTPRVVAAALAPLPARDLAVGVRRVYEFESHRTLTMTTSGAKAAARETRYGLAGRLSFVVAQVDDDLVHVVMRLDDARAWGLAESGPARDALSVPFVVSLEPTGRVAALHFAKGTPAAAANLLTSAVASLQLVAPEDDTAASWETLEDDAAGEYRAAYVREGGSAKQIQKSRLAYVRLVTLEGLRPSNEVADYDVRSNERFDLGADGWPHALEATERVSASTSGEGGIDIDSSATTKAKLVGADRVNIDRAAFEASWDGLITRESARAATFADVRHKIDADRVNGADFHALHGELGRAMADGGLRSKAYPKVAARLGALIRLDPKAATNAALAARTAGSFDEAAALVAALGDAGTPTARGELADLLADDGVESDRRAAAAVYLGNAREVDADSVDVLVKTATGPEADVDPKVREAALLGAGSAVNRANTQGDVSTDDAMTALIEGFEQASTPTERMAFLEALGNTGDGRALPAIQSAFGAPEAEVVATAVMALRLMPASVDPVLAFMLGHAHPLVRRAALTAIGHRSVLPFEAVLLERLGRETDSALRVAIVGLLKALVTTQPELGEILAEVAAKDPDNNVREAILSQPE